MSKLFVCLMMLVVAVATANNIPQPPVITEEDSLADCPKICPALYSPVCGTRNNNIYQMFNNRCELRLSNCNRPRDMDSIKDMIETDEYWCTSEKVENLIDKMEELKVDLNTEACFRPCPMIYSPVCVSNGQYRALLSNDCLLDGINCALEQQALNTSTQAKLYKILRYNTCE